MIRRPPRSTRKESSAASDVYKRQVCEDSKHPARSSLSQYSSQHSSQHDSNSLHGSSRRPQPGAPYEGQQTSAVLRCGAGNGMEAVWSRVVEPAAAAAAAELSSRPRSSDQRGARMQQQQMERIRDSRAGLGEHLAGADEQPCVQQLCEQRAHGSLVQGRHDESSGNPMEGVNGHPRAMNARSKVAAGSGDSQPELPPVLRSPFECDDSVPAGLRRVLSPMSEVFLRPFTASPQ